MEIDIYSNYTVEMVNKGSYRDETGDYKDFKQEETQTINGGELLDLLAIVLQSKKIQVVQITEEKIRAELFDSFTGETEKVIYTIKRS